MGSDIQHPHVLPMSPAIPSPWPDTGKQLFVQLRTDSTCSPQPCPRCCHCLLHAQGWTAQHCQLVRAGFRMRLPRVSKTMPSQSLSTPCPGRAPAVFYAARVGSELQQGTAALITQPDKSHNGKSQAKRGVGQLLSPWASVMKGTMPKERDCATKIGFMKRFYHLSLWETGCKIPVFFKSLSRIKRDHVSCLMYSHRDENCAFEHTQILGKLGILWLSHIFQPPPPHSVMNKHHLQLLCGSVFPLHITD